MGERMSNNIRNNVGEIIRSRSVLFALLRKDLIGRYKNSVLGFAWHFVMPIIMICVYYIVFSEIRTAPMDNFVIYLAIGLFLFNFMITCLSNGSACITNNAPMIKKMYFPRELIVFSQILSSLVVFIIGYTVTITLMIIVGMKVDFIPIIISIYVVMCAILFTTGYVLIFASLTVYKRDVHYFLSSITMVFFFITPIYFNPKDVSGSLNTIVWLNPYTYYVNSMHITLFYNQIPEKHLLIGCTILAVLSIIVGYTVFNKLKRGFAERL